MSWLEILSGPFPEAFLAQRTVCPPQTRSLLSTTAASTMRCWRALLLFLPMARPFMACRSVTTTLVLRVNQLTTTTEGEKRWKEEEAGLIDQVRRNRQ